MTETKAFAEKINARTAEFVALTDRTSAAELQQPVPEDGTEVYAVTIEKADR